MQKGVIITKSIFKKVHDSEINNIVNVFDTPSQKFLLVLLYSILNTIYTIMYIFNTFEYRAS